MHASMRKSRAYLVALQPFDASTRVGQHLRAFILEKLTRLKGAKDVYAYSFGGYVGHLAPRVDLKGCICFAVYRRKSVGKRLTFKRDKKKYPRAQRPQFFTAPEVWAHINGFQGRLQPFEYRQWADSLLEAAMPSYEAQYDTPFLPGPESDEDAQLEFTSAYSKIRKRRPLTPPHWSLMHKIYTLLEWKWAVSASRVSNGYPAAIQASENYLATRFQATREQVRNALDDLDRLGYIQAVMPLPSGKRRKSYCYIPGLGEPPKSLTRTPDISDQQTINRYFAFARKWGHSWRKFNETLRCVRNREAP
jgi:hypothetical protein